MELEVLISCMHRNTEEEILQLVKRTNVKGKCVVVSQCDRNDIVRIGLVTMVFTTERGLSRSRNLAIRYADEDSICLLCDDDEILEADYEKKIISAYSKFKDASVIAFALFRADLDQPYYYPQGNYRLSLSQLLKTSSVQISFIKSDLKNCNILFDEKMGSGSGNGGGEENKFLLDCRRNRLKIFYCGEIIAKLLPSESKWFKGYTTEYFENLGWSSRRSMGSVYGFSFIFYWAFSHTKLYRNNFSIISALRSLMKGYFSKR